MFSSIMSEYLKPLTLDLPLTKDDEENFTIRSIPSNKTKSTISHILKIQETFPLSIIPFIIYYLILGFVIAYISMILFVISLFNLMLFIMLCGIGWKYINWTIKSITSKKMKSEIKSIKSLLLR